MPSHSIINLIALKILQNQYKLKAQKKHETFSLFMLSI